MDMTAKQAIKARCRDCLAGGRECTFTDCALKGLVKAQGRVNRTEAIRKYCRWCMNGHPVNQCASPDCAIYQYRAAYAGGALRVRFLPMKDPLKTPINDGAEASPAKKVSKYS